jgi:hypothetical protein
LKRGAEARDSFPDFLKVEECHHAPLLRPRIRTRPFASAAVGPPRIERIETIKAIDARIEFIDAQEAELVSQAETAGLKI